MKKREQIADIYKWDLTSIYKNIEEFDRDYTKISQEIIDIKKYENKILEDASTFYLVIKKTYEIEGILEKLLVYTGLLFDEDTSNNINQALKEKVSILASKYSENSYFINPSILKMSNEKLNIFYKEEPLLKEYKIVFDNILRYKDYQLEDNEEKLLSSINLVLANNYKTYTLLKDSDMKFKKIKDDNNQLVELDNSNFSLFLSSSNRKVRKSAFMSLYAGYNQYKNTYASLLFNNIKEEITIAKLRKYNSCLESSLFRDELDMSVLDNLIKTVNDNLNILHKYYRLKKKILKLSTLNIYDVYTSTLSTIEPKYSYEEGKNIVRKALSVLKEEYIKIYDKAFDEKWIDVYPNKSKRTGAYSGGSYFTKPFLLLNYQDKYDSVTTLAHEMGHSIHSYFTRTNNTQPYGDYAIFVAEVASTVNELLLAKYMLNNTSSKDEKMYILERMLELFRTTIYRQTMFAEFEKDIYDMVEKDNALTADILCSKYYELNKKYYGKSVKINTEIQYEWERIPHFYYNFYVYKYATGLSAACQIVNNILSEKEHSVDNYLAFLKCGRTKNPKDSLLIAGVDLNSPAFISSALKMFDETIDEYMKLYNK